MRKSLTAAGLTLLLLVLPSMAAGQSPPSADRFQKVVLDDTPGEPMNLAVLPDLRVLHTTRPGELRIYNPRTGLNTIAATFDVYKHDEEGLQSVAIDANFEDNHWVYAYYSPPLNTPVDDPSTPVTNEGDAPFTGTPADFAPFKGVIRLSRFKLERSKLVMSSEQQIIDVPVDRGICCHVGGNIDFDSQGNLYLSTGDDTNPFFSDGYAPLDDSPGRNPAFDARRTAGNTNDLRGKLLRIRVKSGGGYSVPSGNLFRPGTANTRPEIYAMGLRNPFRFAINRNNDDVYLADYSPDAQVANPDRGPAGQGRWMIIRRPGNYGWPFCATPDMPYVDYDFATATPGEDFNCNGPTNDSRHNTGLRKLPQVIQPDVWYTYSQSALFPELGTGGIGPMGGPAYDFDAQNRSVFRWPSYYNGVPLFYEWTRDYVKEFRLNRPNGGRLAEIRDVPLTGMVDNPMDMEFGPDGALYLLNYGDGFFSENPDADLARIDFVRGNHTPVVKVAATPTAGRAPLTVAFSSAGTEDIDGDPIAYAWDFDANGTVDSTAANPTFTYTANGVYNATLRVTDRTGRSASAYVRILVGNQQPVVRLTLTTTGGTFDFGDTVTYTVTVTDDSPVDCSKVTVAYVLGHETHGHPLSSTAGCTGSITTFIDSGHAGAANLSAVFVAAYTDPEGLSGSAQVRLLPGGAPPPPPPTP
ncbi:MAG TPA: PQQ-dependent sugar dehydrogenase [Solirubrobacteraceae bacterium]|nr:PQQ-dependent sugar dehydrogenase [Solirubrobacteraceae bacterium]